MCAVARYYDISSKADRGDIFIIHDQKSSYRTPLLPCLDSYICNVCREYKKIEINECLLATNSTATQPPAI